MFSRNVGPERRCRSAAGLGLVFVLLACPGQAAENMAEVLERARVTELWEPVPPVVTPGDGGSAPADAILLFDGSDLDA